MSNLRALPPWVGRKAMSASSMAAFRECPRKYELQFLRQLTPEGIYVPFFIGDAIHDGLERFYKGEHPREIVQTVQNNVWAKLQTIFVPEDQQAKVNKEISIIAGMLLGYAKHYGVKDRRDTWKNVQTELGFDLTWVDGETRNVGRMDMVGVHTPDGHFWVNEHKTYGGQTSHNYLMKWHLGFQPHNYAWAAHRAHQMGVLAKAPMGVCINVIKKPGIRLKKTETQEAFNARLMNEYLNNPDKYFHREFIPISKKDLEWYEQAQGYWVNQMKKCYDSRHFPQNTDSCLGKYGSSCRYWPICWGMDRGSDPDVLQYFRIREKQFEEVPHYDITDLTN